MTDITHTKIEVKPSKLRCLLQVEWGPESAVKLRLLHRESAWVGEYREHHRKTMEVSGTSDLDLSKKLIKLIKDQPFLYDKTLEEFKDEERKSDAWNVMAQSLNMTVEDAQGRWARLRVDFGRHRRKMKEAEACGNHTRSWPLYDPLTWLAPHIKMRAKRGQRKQDVRSTAESSGYRSNLSHADWLLNSNGSVHVEVSPSIVMHDDQEDITESFIVSPDTADHEDDASLEDSHMYERQHGKDVACSNSYATDGRSGHYQSLVEETEDNLFCRSLSESEIRSFVTQYELELANFMEDMRAAFRAPSSENYIFSLNADTFSWKRPLASGLVAKLGQVKMSKVTPIDAFELVLEQSLGLLSTFEESVKKYKTENQTLTKERDTALSRVIEMSELKANWEKKIYGQFVVVLNAKKERIQALEELLDLKDSDGPQSADGEPRAGKDEVMDDDNDANSSDDDPYAGDTDVDDVDTDEDVKMEPATAPSSSTSTLRRGSELFSSFDSPDSPNPPLILAKRARVSKPASTASTSNASSSTASSSTTSATSVRNIFKDVVEDEPDEAVTGESTQDLIGQL